MISQETELSYFVNKPVSMFRTYSVALHQSNNWDYGFNYLYSTLSFTSSFEFLNHWAISPSVDYLSQGFDNTLLRGGESMLLPTLWKGLLSLHSDLAKKFQVKVSANHATAQNDNYRNSFIEATTTIIPYNVLKLSASVNYTETMDNLQYVDTKVLNNSNKYILAHLNQKTLGATFRVDYNITPELSIQYY